MFELKAIFHNWSKVKEYILALDLTKYVPKPATISLAPKPNQTYRIVHQLEPIDTFIYTALIRDICEIVEAYRIPESDNIACILCSNTKKMAQFERLTGKKNSDRIVLSRLVTL